MPDKLVSIKFVPNSLWTVSLADQNLKVGSIITRGFIKQHDILLLLLLIFLCHFHFYFLFFQSCFTMTPTSILSSGGQSPSSNTFSFFSNFSSKTYFSSPFSLSLSLLSEFFHHDAHINILEWRKEPKQRHFLLLLPQLLVIHLPESTFSFFSFFRCDSIS